MPLVTVLMPVYNCQQFVGEAIKSVLNQTYQEFEFLIINDGSTDRSVDIIQQFSDPRIRLEHNPHNLGLIKTLNRGISSAKGTLIARMDADDICAKERLELQVSYMEKHPECGVLGTWFQLSNGEIIKHPTTNPIIRNVMLFSHCAIGHPTAMLRKKLFTELNHRYSTKYLHAEDFGLWASLINKCDFGNIPIILLTYRIHENQVTNRFQPAQDQSARRARLRIFYELEKPRSKKFIKVFAKSFVKRKKIRLFEKLIFTRGILLSMLNNTFCGNFGRKDFIIFMLKVWYFALRNMYR